MSSIFRRAANLARANVGPVVQQGLRELNRQARRRGGDGGSFGSRIPGLGRSTARTARPGEPAQPVWGGPAQVRTVEVGGRPVTSQTVMYDMRGGLPSMTYQPQRDGEADPGEVVWTWIPYDDDPSSGKDRPALIVARTNEGLVAAQMTSQDRADSSVFTDQYGRVWMNVGTGSWDSQGRESEVRLDRLWVVQPGEVRREGSALDRARFDAVAQRLRMLHG